MEIAEGFQNNWQFPNCVGAIDGKYFEIPKPPKSASVYRNYKGYFSVVMLAACDSCYNFTTITVGSAGSENDAGVFQRSKLGRKLLTGNLDLPSAKPINGTGFVMPYVFVGDEAFPLLNNLMRPFPGEGMNVERRVYNYRHSRARRVIENTFGILVARWRLLMSLMNMLPEYAINAINACVVLHNYIRRDTKCNNHYVPTGFVDVEDPTTGIVTPGRWRDGVPNLSRVELERQSSNNYTMEASKLRNQLMTFFNHLGSVPWQEHYSWYH